MAVTKTDFGTRRTMTPLRLCWAMTIHKSQGLTLENVNLHLGPKENSPGQTFVGISRVKKLTCLNIFDLNKQRIKPLMHDTPNSQKWPSLLQSLNEITRLENLALI